MCALLCHRSIERKENEQGGRGAKRTKASGGAAPRKKGSLAEVKGPEDGPVARCPFHAQSGRERARYSAMEGSSESERE